MIKKIANFFTLAGILSGVLFLNTNCALFDPAQNGPSCEVLGMVCMDLIDIDAVAISDFESECTLSYGVFSNTGCDLTQYDIPGHCESTSSTGFNFALWYRANALVTEALAESDCAIGGGTWVPGM